MDRSVTEVVVPETWTKRYFFGLFRKELCVVSEDVRETCRTLRPGVYKRALDLYLEDGSHVVTDAVVKRPIQRYAFITLIINNLSILNVF